MRRLLKILLLIAAVVTASQSFAQRKTKVELVRARAIKSDAHLFNGARRLIGDVCFKQDSAIMECDSAHFYSDKNRFDAFGHVHLYKLNDTTIDVRADFLRHDGDQKMARFRHNVVLRDSSIVLTTDSLDYNLHEDIGSYEHNGKIVDSLTVLTSLKGFYFHRQHEVYFWKDVVIDHNNKEYQMFTDTLRYGTVSKIIHFFGPTEFYNDTNYMYARYGWYNTVTEKSMFKYDALFRNPKQTITCDSMSFSRLSESGAAYSNVVAVDTTQDIMATGDYVEIHKEPELLTITKKARLIYIFNGDSLYLHADTLKVCRDTSGLFRTFRAYWHVRAYRKDLQLQTDSIYFSMQDSIARFYGNPVFWVQGNQITSEYIEAFIKNKTLSKFILYDNGMIVSPLDSIHFNQVKGMQMVGYMRNNDLYKVDVFKRSQTLYFPVDGDEIIGMNKGESTDMTIYVKNRQVKHIVYRSSPKSNIYPLDNVTISDSRLHGFSWLESVRPKSPDEIFIWKDVEKTSKHSNRIVAPAETESDKTAKKPLPPMQNPNRRK
ncbi:MAG: hypothetical protein IKW86_06070 [Salinivirgaceae bacterium]|nr:hypothetical protein [Salinivirgaceae bacterium]